MTSNTLRALFIVPTCVALGAAGCSGEGGDQSTGGTGGLAPAAGVGGAMAGTGGAMGGTGGSVAGTGGSTGGMAGAATTGGAGGTPTGGSAGMPTGGGAGMTGGAAGGGTGGSTGGAAGSGAGAGGSGGNATCTITPTSEISSKIATVGIVTFTTDLAGVTEAHIDFGLDTNYGMTAPVDLAEPSYRTLLLGMKPSREYHYRISVTGPSGTCMGPDNTIMTGPEASNLPSIDIEVLQEAKLQGGFLITAQYQGSQGTAPAYIIDADGDFVWWYAVGNQLTGARMSYDGKRMWINNANVPESQGANVHLVSMDGLEDENLTSQFTGMSHQLTVLPDETVAFYAYGENNCDDVKERAPDGTVKLIINSATAHGASGRPCHLNSIEYSPEDDTLVFSDLNNNNYTKVTRDGDVVWVLGGTTSDFTGMANWTRQHGIHVLGLDRFVIFNNGAMGQDSIAIEVLLNLGNMSATQPWSYNAEEGISNAVMGDVQRTPNGNTIVSYSTQGVIHEVDAQSQPVRKITWPIGGAFGYVQWRPTLYGPPER
jgi:hypothetical protein